VTLLFAYGSNMAQAEIEAFAPGARFLGAARLDGYRLELRRRSIRWGGGAADIVPRAGAAVWGALYELPDLGALDAKEGAALAAYRRRAVQVVARESTVLAEAYEVIDKEPEEVSPTREYADLLMTAAGERGLPAEYVEELGRRLAKQ